MFYKFEQIISILNKTTPSCSKLKIYIRFSKNKTRHHFIALKYIFRVQGEHFPATYRTLTFLVLLIITHRNGISLSANLDMIFAFFWTALINHVFICTKPRNCRNVNISINMASMKKDKKNNCHKNNHNLFCKTFSQDLYLWRFFGWCGCFK